MGTQKGDSMMDEGKELLKPPLDKKTSQAPQKTVECWKEMVGKIFYAGLPPVTPAAAPNTPQGVDWRAE